jgi:protein-tyrosine-phosphatase
MSVLFVCTGNAHRSPLAEALLKKLRSDLQVESAGLQVAIPIAEGVKEYLKKHGAADYLKKAPENLSTKQICRFDLIVAMEQKHRQAIIAQHPECESRIVVWGVRDPYFLPPEEAERIYRQIQEKVTELARTL